LGLETAFRYDLHIHSNCSDGKLSPLEILQSAKQANLLGLSITDHDTVQAYSDELFLQADAMGLKLLTGVEFSAKENQTTVHLLGYGFDYRHPAILNFCQKHLLIRENRNREMIAKLAKKGFKITYEELLQKKTSSSQVLGRPHIGELLLEKGHVRNLEEAFERYLGDERSCYVEPNNPSIEETIAVIHEAKGLAVLAHPYLFKKRRILKEILKKPFDGIECFYAKIPRHMAEDFVKICVEKNWLVTGGSDFHGSAKPYLHLGSSFIQQNEYDLILKRLALK
jgi:predicted metal-dependent phosphoesterase TrpH